MSLWVANKVIQHHDDTFRRMQTAVLCRCVVQLSLLGYILVPIFRYRVWWLVLLYATFMLIMGTLEAVQSPAYTYKVPFSRPTCSSAMFTRLIPWFS